MSTPAEQVKIPTPSSSSGQALSHKTREGWGNRTPVAFDLEYSVGARNAVNVCLRVQPEEKVCVITDEATQEIAAAIVAELGEAWLPASRVGFGRCGRAAAEGFAAGDCR